ncbi:MAG: ABC-F family ATP-binding cassette domain-containing protein [Candidatus Paceibacterota bacterium]|jgi:ATPase subunit of ABC transporter with duplicated ATPase domains
MHNKNQQSVIFSCSHISKKFELIEVLKDISFTISKNEKVGLVGSNGSGKSTLLKIIANLLEKDSGTISYSKKIKIKYLPQIHTEEEKLSGGEIAKKILLPIISSDADLFILDEPTNNLDIDGLNMIENFITKSNKAFLIVSHDRMFLDKIVTKIIEIDLKTKSSSIYDGNYSDYIKQREEKILLQWKEYKEKIEKTDKINGNIELKSDWLKNIESKKKGKKAKDDDSINVHWKGADGKAARRLKVMKNKLERFEKDAEDIKKPMQGLPLKVSFDNEHGSIKVFDLKDIEKKIGKRKIGPINLRIQYGDKIHIIGKNGTGKTTLLKILVGELQTDSGIIEKGENIKVGYISQERWLTRPNKTVIEEFLETTKISETEARKILHRFRITTEDVNKHLSLISPGEYSRLIIAELLATKPNCIILDEPTNHLDLEVTEELENGLKDYKGTLIIVSHDRYFLEKQKINRVFDLNINSIRL